MQNLLSINSEIENLNKIFFWIDKIAKINNFPEELNTKLQLVSEEIFANISAYAYKNTSGNVEIVLDIKNDEITLQFTDNGIIYNPLDYDADITVSIDKRTQGGFGLLLVKNNADAVSYEQKNNQNILTVKFYLNKKQNEVQSGRKH